MMCQGIDTSVSPCLSSLSSIVPLCVRRPRRVFRPSWQEVEQAAATRGNRCVSEARDERPRWVCGNQKLSQRLPYKSGRIRWSLCPLALKFWTLWSHYFSISHVRFDLDKSGGQKRHQRLVFFVLVCLSCFKIRGDTADHINVILFRTFQNRVTAKCFKATKIGKDKLKGTK